jgi:phosphatidylglycerophosphate synthase
MHAMTEKESTLYDLLFRAPRSVRVINFITLYRTVTFPLLIWFIISDREDIFQWLLVISFLTDAVDGYLARKFKATSILGAKLDSIGDDLTILAGVIGLFVFRLDFLKVHWPVIAFMLGLFLIQLAAALLRYRKITSFHTYLAKTAAVLQGFFLCSLFLFQSPAYWLFYTAAAVTTLELIEEIIMVIILPEWRVNVHGLYWVWRERKRAIRGAHSKYKV